MRTVQGNFRALRVGLIASEFFDSTITGHADLGGYGMLARNYIAEYIPCDEIEIETILGFSKNSNFEYFFRDSRKKIVLLPNHLNKFSSKNLFSLLKHYILKSISRYRVRKYLRTFDLFVVIQASNRHILNLIPNFVPLILYIQDPRPKSDWDEIDTVPTADTGSPRPGPELRMLFKRFIQENRFMAISQNSEIIAKARELYDLPTDLDIATLKNPVFISNDMLPSRGRKLNAVAWLGRLDSVKRPWLALEVARLMPDVEFYFMGTVQQEIVNYIIYPYKDLANVRLLGHIEGEEKRSILSKTKVLINTSIHEATPISFLEALSHENLIISCQNPDEITSSFGIFVGIILGDGRDNAGLFVEGIRKIIGDDERYGRLARRARDYVLAEHDVRNWQTNLRGIIRKGANRSLS